MVLYELNLSNKNSRHSKDIIAPIEVRENVSRLKISTLLAIRRREPGRRAKPSKAIALIELQFAPRGEIDENRCTEDEMTISQKLHQHNCVAPMTIDATDARRHSRRVGRSARGAIPMKFARALREWL